MAFGTNWAYAGNIKREDLADLIAQIGYKKRPTYDLLGDTMARSDAHEWNERGLLARTLTSQQQGFSYTAAETNLPTRRANRTQILARQPFVSYTSASTAMAGVESLVTDAIKLETTNLLNLLNYNLLNSTLVSGNTATGQTMQGLMAVLYASPGLGLITLNCGTSVDASNINDIQSQLESLGMAATDFFVSATLKQRLSTLTTSNTKYVMAADKMVTESLSVYEGDFGVSQIQCERDLVLGTGGSSQGYAMPSQAGIKQPLVGLDRSMWRKAWLRKPEIVNVPEREDGALSIIKTELTLEYLSASAGVFDYNVF